MVMLILLPMEVRKSSSTSTLFFSAQASTSFFMAASPVGTQWSHSAIFSLPAAPAVRICTSGSALGGAPSFSALRREILLLMTCYTPLAMAVPPLRPSVSVTTPAKRRPPCATGTDMVSRQAPLRNNMLPGAPVCRAVPFGYRGGMAAARSLIRIAVNVALDGVLSRQRCRWRAGSPTRPRPVARRCGSSRWAP